MGACRARTQQLWPTNHPQHSRETWMHASDARNSPTQLQTGHSQPACKATHLEPANSLRLPVVQIQTTLLISPRSSARHQGTRNIPFCLQATLSNHTHNGRYQFNKNFGNNSNNYPNPSSSTKWINYNLLSSRPLQVNKYSHSNLPTCNYPNSGTRMIIWLICPCLCINGSAGPLVIFQGRCCSRLQHASPPSKAPPYIRHL